MITSHDWVSSLEKQLLTKKLHMISNRFGNGYFIFEMGENSTFSFEIKELRGWLFGVWFEFDDKIKNCVVKADLFIRNKDDLDKFKPSRSYFRETYFYKTEDSVENFEGYEFSYVSDFCLMAKKHPIYTYCVESENAYYGGNGFLPQVNLVFRFVSEKIRVRAKEIRKWYCEKTQKFNLDWIRMNKIKKELEKNYSDVISKVRIIDKNNSNFICSPRFDMYITWNFNFDDNKECVEPYTIPFFSFTGKPKLSRDVSVEWTYPDKKGRWSFIPCKEEMMAIYGWKYRIFGRKKYERFLYH